jgi:hypothetical protein
MTKLIRPLGLLLLLGTSFMAYPVKAGTSFEFLFSSNSIADDSQLMLHLAVGDYGYPRHMIEPVLPRLHYCEVELPVVLFLAHASGRSIDFIVGLRSEPLSWHVVFERCGVPYDVLFVGMDRDPGPPYGKAWGHWRKTSGKGALSDDSIAGLVQLQTAHRLTGIPVLDVVRAGREGRSVAVVVADKKGRPHRAAEGGHANAGKSGKGGKPGKGK